MSTHLPHVHTPMLPDDSAQPIMDYDESAGDTYIEKTQRNTMVYQIFTALVQPTDGPAFFQIPAGYEYFWAYVNEKPGATTQFDCVYLRQESPPNAAFGGGDIAVSAWHAIKLPFANTRADEVRIFYRPDAGNGNNVQLVLVPFRGYTIEVL